jgi:hypothetical protein
MVGWYMKRDLKGSGRVLMEILSWHLPGLKKNYQKPQYR